MTFFHYSFHPLTLVDVEFHSYIYRENKSYLFNRQWNSSLFFLFVFLLLLSPLHWWRSHLRSELAKRRRLKWNERKSTCSSSSSFPFATWGKRAKLLLTSSSCVNFLSWHRSHRERERKRRKKRPKLTLATSLYNQLYVQRSKRVLVAWAKISPMRKHELPFDSPSFLITINVIASTGVSTFLFRVFTSRIYTIHSSLSNTVAAIHTVTVTLALRSLSLFPSCILFSSHSTAAIELNCQLLKFTRTYTNTQWKGTYSRSHLMNHQKGKILGTMWTKAVPYTPLN